MRIYCISKDDVSILTNNENNVCGYINSEAGRKKLELECPIEITQEVYTVWGDTLSFTEWEPLPTPQSTEPTLESRIAALETAKLTEMEV